MVWGGKRNAIGPEDQEDLLWTSVGGTRIGGKIRAAVGKLKQDA